MYRFFEHTADLGMTVEAPDLDTLFREAARGLFAMVAEAGAPTDGPQQVTLEIPGTRRDHLLFDWLSELLYLFDARGLLVGSFDVKVSPDGVHAVVRGRPLDLDVDHLLHEVKAITYHGLEVEACEAGWRAKLIVDI